MVHLRNKRLGDVCVFVALAECRAFSPLLQRTSPDLALFRALDLVQVHEAAKARSGGSCGIGVVQHMQEDGLMTD